MMLEALLRLTEQEELMTDSDYEIKPVAWLIRVGEGGELIGIEDMRYTPDVGGKRKVKPVGKNMRIPRQRGRSGTKAPAAFLVDNAKYVFGKSTRDKPLSPEEGREKSGWFRDLAAACATATNDSGILAVQQFLDRMRAGELEVDLPEECVSNELFAFVYEPDIEQPVHERSAIRAYWSGLRQEVSEEGNGLHCIITGDPVAEVPLFPLLKGVPGGTSSGVAFVSFNESAFESHGWSRNENAPMSRSVAEAISTALNRLLHPAFPNPEPESAGETLPRRNFRISSDTVVCFWASERSAQDFLDDFAAIFNSADPGAVGEMYQSLWNGRAIQLDDVSRFYALTLTGTQGRAIVRDWFESSLKDVAAHLAAYFADLDIVRNTPPPKGRELPPQFPLHLLLESMAPLGKRENIAAPLSAQFIHAALRGAPYPLAVLQKGIERARAEIGGTEWADLARRDARAALIKAVLRRNFKLEIERSMDPTNHEPGYLLGRLMAVLERLQQVALGDVNATVIDRFFGAASAAPQAVYPRLLKNARHHARKGVDDARQSGTAVWLDRQIDQILSQIGVAKPGRGQLHQGFPSHLALDQQGLFVLGYHHQRHWLWLSREERERLQTSVSTPQPDTDIPASV